MRTRALLFTDGGSRGNPGPAGIGYVLKIHGQVLVERGEYIGRATNNQAEYKALIAGLELVAQRGVREVKVFMDSELVVKQLKGEYRVRNADLMPLCDEVKKIQRRFDKFVIKHIAREKNKEADRLVNEALDKNKRPSN